MATFRHVPINGKEVESLADLTGIKEDLKSTIELCDLLQEILQGDRQDFRILEALSSAILIRYFRSFGGSVRVVMPKSAFDELDTEMLKDHNFFKEIRDKHIAHSVNAFENNLAIAWLNPEGRGKREVLSVSVQHSRVVSLRIDELNRLRSLCDHFQEKVGDLMKVENEKALKYARSLPVDELYEREARAPMVLTYKDAGKRRKRL